MKEVRTAAVMQPYIFPYLGYFHLLHASDIFVFYDDVNYIKGGWINRNRILARGKDLLITVPVSNASPNNLIKDVRPAVDQRWRHKLQGTLHHCYHEAPFYKTVIDRIMGVFSKDYSDITDLAIESVLMVYTYLDRHLNYVKSSTAFPDTRGLARADRLIEITRRLGCTQYVNAPGGKALYSKEYFANRGLSLLFIESFLPEYRQFDHPFVPGLSIIDVMMFNDSKQIEEHFQSHRLT